MFDRILKTFVDQLPSDLLETIFMWLHNMCVYQRVRKVSFMESLGNVLIPVFILRLLFRKKYEFLHPKVLISTILSSQEPNLMLGKRKSVNRSLRFLLDSDLTLFFTLFHKLEQLKTEILFSMLKICFPSMFMRQERPIYQLVYSKMGRVDDPNKGEQYRL